MPISTSTVATGSATRVGGGFYSWAALTCVLIAVIGFARSYYLKWLFGTPPLPSCFTCTARLCHRGACYSARKLTSSLRIACVSTGA